MNEVIRLDIPATGAYLELVGESVAEVLRRIPDIEQREDVTPLVQLAVHEACLNIIQHGYDEGCGRMLLLLSADPDSRRFIADIEDTGRPFDPANVPEPCPQGQVRGYGVYIIQQVMDRVTHEVRGGTNRLCLEKEL